MPMAPLRFALCMWGPGRCGLVCSIEASLSARQALLAMIRTSHGHFPRWPHANGSSSTALHLRIARWAECRCGGHTHKSLKGNSFATPPRTTKTATAKFTMRLKDALAIGSMRMNKACAFRARRSGCTRRCTARHGRVQLARAPGVLTKCRKSPWRRIGWRDEGTAL